MNRSQSSDSKRSSRKSTSNKNSNMKRKNIVVFSDKSEDILKSQSLNSWYLY